MMIPLDLLDKTNKPELAQLMAYVENPLFEALCERLREEYRALHSIDYSGDNVLPGWNVSFRKAGRTLCRLYPKKGRFAVLVVVGQREKMRVERELHQMSDEMQAIYRQTKEGMGQRWLVYDLTAPDALYRDTLSLIRARRES